MGYKDRTWCASPKCKNKCGRKFTVEDLQDAIKWWGNLNFPISRSMFCDSEGELIVYDSGENERYS